MSEIAPGERRELRSVVRGQFKVLRAEVKRREQEMKAEIEAELVAMYRQQDADIALAVDEVAEITRRAVREALVVRDALRAKHPDVRAEVSTRFGNGIHLDASNINRAQVHRALVAAIPNKVGDANLNLDREEVRLLRSLSEGALESDEARGFLGEIPTVGELIPAVRLRELETGISDVTT